MDHKKTAVIDFDNTISGYDTWRGEEVLGPPIPYAKDAILELIEWGWHIVIFTTRGNTELIKNWLKKYNFPECEVNSTKHNPPNTSNKPIGEVYFDDRDAHVVGELPYNWHKAMARVRKKYQPSLDTWIDDASIWAGKWNRFFAIFERNRYARHLPVLLDCEKLRQEGKSELAEQLELGLMESEVV